MSEPRVGKIFFVINSLVPGGAERVACTLASKLAESQEHWTVALVTLDCVEEVYAPSTTVARALLDSGGRLIPSVRALLRLMRQERPDIIVSFLSRANCAAIACSQMLRIPCIISERVHTTSHFSSNNLGGLNKLAVRSLYPYADRVIAVSQGVAEDLIYNFGVSARKVITIPNPIDIHEIEHAARAEPAISIPSNYIVAVGRLVPNKNFTMLLRSYARADIDSALIILGEGSERNKLRALASELGLADKVHMPGFIANPHAIVGRAKFYVSASNAEGFPNAMVEAMCVGRPVVATDCDSGPSEILCGRAGYQKVSGLTQAAFGILVPMNDEEAMSEALRVMAHPDVHTRFAAAARQRASQFGLEHSIAQYKEAIVTTLTSTHRTTLDKFSS